MTFGFKVFSKYQYSFKRDFPLRLMAKELWLGLTSISLGKSSRPKEFVCNSSRIALNSLHRTLKSFWSHWKCFCLWTQWFNPVLHRWSNNEKSGKGTASYWVSVPIRTVSLLQWVLPFLISIPLVQGLIKPLHVILLNLEKTSFTL